MTTQYSLTLRILHWASAGLIALQVALAIANILLYEPRPVLAETLVQTHISCGVLVFALTLIRIVVRMRTAPVSKSPRPLLNILSSGAHKTLYACLVILPVTGYIKLAALGFTIRLFGHLPLPDLPMNVALAQSAAAWHTATAMVLGCLVTLHIGAALFHPKLDGRAVLPGMALGFAGRVNPQGPKA